MKPPLPLEGSSRRRAYARSTVWSRSEKSDMERIRTWGSVRRAQRASGDSGGAVVRARLVKVLTLEHKSRNVFRAQVTEGAVVEAQERIGAVRTRVSTGVYVGHKTVKVR